METQIKIASKILNQPGCDIHYYVSGNPNGETILFLHPAFADHRCFNPQLRAFEEKFQIITIDMIGHGLSQPSKTTDKIDKTSHHINQLLEIEQISKIHIVGVSLGSLIAQHFAIMHPDKVNSLVVLGGYSILNDTKEVMKAQRREGFKWMLKALLSMHAFRSYVSKISVHNPISQAEIYKMATCFKRKSFMRMSGMGKVLNEGLGAEIKCPLLILVGENDIELAHRESKAFHEHIPTSKFRIIANAGHVANMDNPIEFNKLLKEFVEAYSKD